MEFGTLFVEDLWTVQALKSLRRPRQVYLKRRKERGQMRNRPTLRLTIVAAISVTAFVPYAQGTDGNIAIELQTVAEGLTAPVYLTGAGDGSGRLFILDQIGLIRVVKNGALLATPFLDVSSLTPTPNEFFDERGLLGLAFHPNYENNGRFFVRYSAPRAGDPAEPCNNPAGFVVGCHEEILSEFRVLGDPGSSDVADLSSEIILFRVDEPQFNHDSGQVAFGPDGLLYWTLGDGGGANDGLADLPPSHGPVGNAQNVATALGNVLRIDVDSPPDPGLNYAVPPGNPFAGGGGVPEIYAYGFRNPYRFSFDDGPGGTGELYVADVGQNLFEEVSILPVAAAPGLLNYGWVIREGAHCFDPSSPVVPPLACPNTGPFAEPLLEPAIEFPHPTGCGSDADCASLGTTCGPFATCNNPSGIAVIGGFVYRGFDNPILQGKYVFGDFAQAFFLPSGRLFYADTTGLDAFDIKEFVIAPSGLPLGKFLFGIGEDDDGELYALASDNLGPTGNGGIVYRIVAARDATEIPTVSEWGLVILAFLLMTALKVYFRRPAPANGVG